MMGIGQMPGDAGYGDTGAGVDTTTLTFPQFPGGTIPGTGTPVNTNTSSSGVPWYATLLSNLGKTAGGVLASRYAVPQLNPGQLIQGPQGLMYQGSPGSTFPTFSTLTAGSSLLPLVLIGGGLLFITSLARR